MVPEDLKGKALKFIPYFWDMKSQPSIDFIKISVWINPSLFLPKINGFQGNPINTIHALK